MIQVTYNARLVRDGVEVESGDVMADGLVLDEVLADSISYLLTGARRPRRFGESLFLTMADPPRHVTQDGRISTHNASRRNIRRSLKRLWPEGTEAPEIARLAAFILLEQKRARIYLTPIGILVAARD